MHKSGCICGLQKQGLGCTLMMPIGMLLFGSGVNYSSLKQQASVTHPNAF